MLGPSWGAQIALLHLSQCSALPRPHKGQWVVRGHLAEKVLGPAHPGQSGKACQLGHLLSGMNGINDQLHVSLPVLAPDSLVTHDFPVKHQMLTFPPPPEPQGEKEVGSSPGFAYGALHLGTREGAE